LIRLDEGDVISSVTRVVESEDNSGNGEAEEALPLLDESPETGD